MGAKKSAKSGPKKRRSRKKAAEPVPRGLAAAEVGEGSPPAEVEALGVSVLEDGGRVLGAYRDPLGGHWTLLVALPLDRVEPTPFQRDISPAHVARLEEAIGRLGMYLDPVLVVRNDEGSYWTPNGHHRTSAMRQLGARSIVALLVPDRRVAYRILALNTEKAHNLKEKSLEVIRMARSLATLDPRPETEFETEFEEPGFLTLGCCYEKRGRFSGSAYNPVLKRVERFIDAPLPEALEIRESRGARLLELDEAVNEVVKELKEGGFDSPYLKTFVVARINPLRFKRSTEALFDEVVDQMLEAAHAFDPGKVRPEQLARSAGPAGD